MREIRLVRVDKVRPALVLTRATALDAMTKVTVAPITSTIKGLSSEVLVGVENGVDHASAVSLDNVVTVPKSVVGRVVGYLLPHQEQSLARAVAVAYDLELSLFLD